MRREHYLQDHWEREGECVLGDRVLFQCIWFLVVAGGAALELWKKVVPCL